ncbi:MAG TPA: acetyl-CoA carboxylase biotin carboxyl carrier protein [Trueperaceae bacterium]
MDIKDIKKLLDAVAASEVRELTLETGEYKLNIKRGGDYFVEAQPPRTPQAGGQTSPEAPILPTATPPQPESVQPPESAAATKYFEVSAPIVGTFYAAPAPDAPDFVKVGDRVEPGSVLCIIEAMKLMNEIEAEVSGTIAEILVYNEEPVEYGQTLFRIAPS